MTCKTSQLIESPSCSACGLLDREGFTKLSIGNTCSWSFIFLDHYLPPVVEGLFSVIVMTGVSTLASTGAEETKIFRACVSVFERFPGVADGQEMVEAIFEHFALNRNAQVDFFDSDGRPQVVSSGQYP